MTFRWHHPLRSLGLLRQADATAFSWLMHCLALTWKIIFLIVTWSSHTQRWPLPCPKDSPSTAGERCSPIKGTPQLSTFFPAAVSWSGSRVWSIQLWLKNDEENGPVTIPTNDFMLKWIIPWLLPWRENETWETKNLSEVVVQVQWQAYLTAWNAAHQDHQVVGVKHQILCLPWGVHGSIESCLLQVASHPTLNHSMEDSNWAQHMDSQAG